MKWRTVVISGGILLLNLLIATAISVSTSSILQDVAAFNASCFPKDSCRQDKVINAPI